MLIAVGNLKPEQTYSSVADIEAREVGWRANSILFLYEPD